VFVQARLKLDVRAVEEFLRLPQRLVEAAERRAAIARDEAARIEAGARVALPLQDQQADERLHAGQEDAAGTELVSVVERDVAKRDGGNRSGQGHRRKLQESCSGSRREFVNAAASGKAIVSLVRIEAILPALPCLRRRRTEFGIVSGPPKAGMQGCANRFGKGLNSRPPGGSAFARVAGKVV